jgi:hypothetical protein
LDALFGVVNIPNVVWIDEDGIIVRPAEPGWAGPQALPEELARRARRSIGALLAGGQDRDGYPDALRDWVANGRASRFYLSPAEVVERSQPRPLSMSEGAAHFELANHLWRHGRRDAAIAHFKACHRLQPDNWTYKRQAWSLVGHARVGGPLGRFAQGPLPGEESAWPFESDFPRDVARLQPGEYYPNTLGGDPARNT